MRRSLKRYAGIFALTALAALCFTFVGGRAVSEEAANGKTKAKVTYAKEVSRILQDNCQVCHHAGTAAPFSLMTYDDATKWADNIKEAVSDKRMPPWYADPHYGKFANDRRLKPADMEALMAWIDTGMERGNQADDDPHDELDQPTGREVFFLVLGELVGDQDGPARGHGHGEEVAEILGPTGQVDLHQGPAHQEAGKRGPGSSPAASGRTIVR